MELDEAKKQLKEARSQTKINEEKIVSLREKIKDCPSEEQIEIWKNDANSLRECRSVFEYLSASTQGKMRVNHQFPLLTKISDLINEYVVDTKLKVTFSFAFVDESTKIETIKESYNCRLVKDVNESDNKSKAYNVVKGHILCRFLFQLLSHRKDYNNNYPYDMLMPDTNNPRVRLYLLFYNEF